MLEINHIDFVQEIKTQIKKAQYRALQKVNKEQIQLYWNIGKTILERQLQYGWGKGIVEVLATELQKEFIGINGFSARNLWRMRTLYEQYVDSLLILPPLVAEIPWTHNILILEKCKDEHQRFYYINMTKKFQWSKTMLINAIDNNHYQNMLLSQTNFTETLEVEIAQNADLKIDEFKPEMAGKMNFYLSTLNKLVKKDHENPSIGVIICKSKNRTTVEFALQDVNKPIGVATYTVNKELPKNLSAFFPSNQEFVDKVESITHYIKKLK